MVSTPYVSILQYITILQSRLQAKQAVFLPYCKLFPYVLNYPPYLIIMKLLKALQEVSQP
jgi:hypothetical protein